MRKGLLWLLTLLLLLGATPAGAETPDYSEPMDIEIMAYYVMDVPTTDPIMVYLADMFNINFKLTVTNIDNYSDTLNMRIASDDIPDWFRVRVNSIYRQLAEDGLLLDVSAVAEKYGFENVQATFALANADGLMVDGAFYCVPDSTGKLNPGIYYRKDWLDELGLEAPKTYDDLKACLEAIVAADPDGKGTVGYTAYSVSQIERMLPGWTGYYDWGLRGDGSMIYKYEDEGYKDFAKYLADLYANNLLDQELFINSYEVCMEKLASGRAGFYTMNMNTTWWGNNKANLLQYDPEAELGALVPFPEGPAGALAGVSFGFSASSSFNANVDEAKAERMLALMDYLLSEEGRELALFGYEEGVYYDLVDGVKVQNEERTSKDWGQSLHFMGELADFGTNDLLASDEELLNFYDYQDIPESTRLYKLSNFANDEATVLLAEIVEVETYYRMAFITGELDVDEAWDEFQQRLKDAGIDRYRELLGEYLTEAGITLDAAVNYP